MIKINVEFVEKLEIWTCRNLKSLFIKSKCNSENYEFKKTYKILQSSTCFYYFKNT